MRAIWPDLKVAVEERRCSLLDSILRVTRVEASVECEWL